VISPALTAIAQTPDEILISGSWDMTIKLRNIHTGGLRHNLSGHLLPVSALALNSHHILATGSHDATVKLWDLASGRAIASLSGHTKAVESVASSADGSILASASQDGTIRVYSVSV
jgi:WD40 repeat protein